MELILPVFVEHMKARNSRRFHRVSLLFLDSFQAEDEVLQRAMQRLARITKKRLLGFGQDWNHRLLNAFLLNPEVGSQRVKLALNMRNSTHKVTYFIAKFRNFDRTICFNPKLPDIWFEVADNESVNVRAAEVYENYFRQKQREEARVPFLPPEHYALDREAWVSELAVDVSTNQKSRSDEHSDRMALWSNETMDGAIELNRVGRCLDWLYPDDLHRAIRRDAFVDRIESLLAMREQRPLLIVGGKSVGKTAVIHEVVRRRVEARQKNQGTHHRNVWLLAPQRIVSGMSYVGQWENRVLAIIREAESRNHVLYFDDLLGLFRAGQTSGSDLSVADLLKNAMLNQKIRVLGEITPEAYDKLTDRDRAFADLFHVERLEPTTPDETMQIAIHMVREQEHRQGVCFNFDAIPEAIKLQRQFVKNAEFPGKVSEFIKRLAIKRSQSAVSRYSVDEEFSEMSGISISLVDDRCMLKRSEIEAKMRHRIAGQQEAVNACVDVVSMAKARLSDPNKPLATMLFMGPTGVGKTECAKALAGVMYENEDQFIRFDLNEFKTVDAVARLVGTFDNPEGLLTRAIRQRPFCVVLLDEIEKAHPDVYDILLQVTGEGRLTDGYGQTTDFTNAVIVMTSNLGSTSSAKSSGFGQSDTAQSEHRFIQAARKFFRPEFFNRIDRLIPFHALERAEIERIAEMMMQKVISREGLVRRRCILQVDSDTIRKIVDLGFHQEWGARALKRAVESSFTQPVARELSKIQNQVPTLIEVSSSDEGKFDIRTTALQNAKATRPLIDSIDKRQLVESSREFVSRIHDDALENRPEGEISASGMTPELLKHFAVLEQVDVVKEVINEIQNRLQYERESATQPMLPVTGDKIKRSRKIEKPGGSFRERPNRWLKELNSVKDIRNFIDERAIQLEAKESEVAPDVKKLANESAFLKMLTQDTLSECWFAVEPFGRADEPEVREDSPNDLSWIDPTLAQMYLQLLIDFGFEYQQFVANIENDIPVNIFKVSGTGASSLLNHETGVQLRCNVHGELQMLRTGLVQLDGKQKKQLLESSQNNESKTNEVEPVKIGPLQFVESSNYQVLRMFDHLNRLVDFRTGVVIEQCAFAEKLLHGLLLGSLELPAEWAPFIENESD